MEVVMNVVVEEVNKKLVKEFNEANLEHHWKIQ